MPTRGPTIFTAIRASLEQQELRRMHRKQQRILGDMDRALIELRTESMRAVTAGAVAVLGSAAAAA
jgi:hypothetical protein